MSDPLVDVVDESFSLIEVFVGEGVLSLCILPGASMPVLFVPSQDD